MSEENNMAKKFKQTKKEIKRTRYWLNGGIIGGIFDIILILIMFLSIYIIDIFPIVYTLNSIFNFYNLTIYSYFLYGELQSPLLALIFSLLVPFLLYIIVGALIGFIYGKIKKRFK